MSFDALRWAARQRTQRPSDKLVLWCLADFARHQAIAYPAVLTIAAFTQLNRKTVIEALSRLEDIGLISNAGVTGRTKQVNRYLLHLERGPQPEQFHNWNRSESAVEGSRKRDTKPVYGTQEQGGPVENFHPARPKPPRTRATMSEPQSVGVLTKSLVRFAIANVAND